MSYIGTSKSRREGRVLSVHPAHSAVQGGPELEQEMRNKQLPLLVRGLSSCSVMALWVLTVVLISSGRSRVACHPHQKWGCCLFPH